jgi:hypothetical protein
VASCFSEAEARLTIAKCFLGLPADTSTCFQQRAADLYDERDLFEWRNFLYMSYLELFKEIKKATGSSSSLTSSSSSSSLSTAVVAASTTEQSSKENLGQASEVNIKAMIEERVAFIRNLLAKNKKVGFTSQLIQCYQIHFLLRRFTSININRQIFFDIN